MKRNGLVFVGGEMLLTYMIFVYHWTSRKMKKGPKNFSKAIDKATVTLIEIL